MPTPEFLASEHPIYKLRKAEWERQELRFRGGPRLIEAELAAFDWETEGRGPLGLGRDIHDVPDTVLMNPFGGHLQMRQAQAVYLNFMDDVAKILIGHIMKKAPLPEEGGGLNFGSLGLVRRRSNRTEPTRAEQLYYNADGVGVDASQWDNFWSKVARDSLNTGHRWIEVAAPVAMPDNRVPSRADELLGRRPFLINYSPLRVDNWHYEDGQLQWAKLLLRIRRPRLVNGVYEGNETEKGWRVFIRKGYTGFGAAYAGGGWWEFDPEHNKIPGRNGTWDATGGAIPFWAHFFERDDDEFSRGALTELGNVAIAYMNLDSAATFDAWDAAQSIQILLGATPDQHAALLAQIASGSKIAAIPPVMDKVLPQIYDASSGAVAAMVFDQRLKSLRDAVRELAGTAAIGGLDASGEAKKVGFADRKSPRLAMVASELEVSQNIAINFLEQRWVQAKPPSGAVVWPRDFELAPVLEQIGKLFDLEKVTGMQSVTADTVALMTVIRQLGLVAEDDMLKKIEAEYGTAGALRLALLIASGRNPAQAASGEDAAAEQNAEQAELARLAAGRPATPEPAAP